jgi:hypothetical protein
MLVRGRGLVGLTYQFGVGAVVCGDGVSEMYTTAFQGLRLNDVS